MDEVRKETFRAEGGTVEIGIVNEKVTLSLRSGEKDVTMTLYPDGARLVADTLNRYADTLPRN